MFNTRRAIFADIRVREAILRAVRLRMGQPQLSSSIVMHARPAISMARELSAHGTPADAREAALLAPFAGAVRADIMAGQMGAADRRRLRPRPRHAVAPRLRSARRGPDTILNGTQLVHRDQPTKALHLRDTHHHATSRNGSALALRAQPQARRHRCACAHRRCHAVRPPAHRLRFRHDGIPLGPVVVARQRAVVLLGFGCCRSAGQP